MLIISYHEIGRILKSQHCLWPTADHTRIHYTH